MLHLCWNHFTVIFQEFLELDELRYKGLTKTNPGRMSDKGILVNNITASWNKVSNFAM